MRFCTTCIVSLLMGAFASPVLAGNELSLEWDWALSYETVKQRDTHFIPAQGDSCDSLNALLDVQMNYQNISGLFSFFSQGLYLNQHDRKGWGSESDNQLLIRELVWQNEWQIGDAILDISVGKLRVDWGVGYGYRVLDLFKPYRQNPVGLVAEEGAGVFSVSHYDLAGEWTLIATDSSWGQQEQSALDQATEQQGVGVRRYMLVDDTEFQWIGYYDDVRRGLLGASVITVWDESIAMHSSLLWQKQSVSYQISDQLEQPVSVDNQGSAFQALVGLNWANQAGHNVIAEYWYDSRAWSTSEWEKAISRGDLLSSFPSTWLLASSYAQGFQHANIVQHNVMLHWSWDIEAWAAWSGATFMTENMGWLSDVTPTLDVLISPQDGGAIVTQWVSYQWIDTGEQSVELEAAARFLSGDKQSAYAQINDKYMIVFNIKGKF
ncbi:hypothetical protein [Vibrio natriegens]|uniref:hypothetical protein n=1 Tax=Vibrio natriegens TaxID=691 RepID=UPI0008041B03|nr:hypothetical protein [Vibrio natriegens]ANQ18681.1 hypothetical protein BA891_15845 [Vibrio natriegens]